MSIFLKKQIDKATLIKVILSTIAFIIMYVIINYSPFGVAGLLEITNGANILDFEFGYSAEKAYEILTALGNEGRSFYLSRIVPLDFPFPFASMLFYFYFTAYALKIMDKKKFPLYLTLLFPVLCMIFDWIENVFIIIMLSQYPNISPMICGFGSIMTVLKFVFTFIKTLSVIVLLAAAIISRLKRRV